MKNIDFETLSHFEKKQKQISGKVNQAPAADTQHNREGTNTKACMQNWTNLRKLKQAPEEGCSRQYRRDKRTACMKVEKR